MKNKLLHQVVSVWTKEYHDWNGDHKDAYKVCSCGYETISSRDMEQHTKEMNGEKHD